MPEFHKPDDKKVLESGMSPEEIRAIPAAEVVGSTPEQTADRVEESARKETDAFVKITESTPELTANNKTDLITKAEGAFAHLESGVKTIEEGETEPNLPEQAKEKAEKKEYSRKEILDSLEDSIVTLKKEYALLSPGQRNSPQGKELEWVIDSVNLAKMNSVDQGNDQLKVDLINEQGVKAGEQQEGIPVEGVLKFLQLYEQQLKKMSVPAEKSGRLQQLEAIIVENEKLRHSGGVVPENAEAFQRKNIAERDAILALAEKDPEYVHAKEIQETIENNSKPYFEAHFGKPSDALSPEEQQQQHTRTQTEAKFISLDYRATGNTDTDYQLAMDIMSNRRELVLPKEEAIEPALTSEPILEVPPIVKAEVESPSEPEPKPEPTPEPRQELTPEPKSDVPLPPRPETEPKPEREKEVLSLEFLRNTYAVAVNGRKKFFGRTSETYVGQAREAYEKVLKEQFKDQLENEFAGLDLKDQKVLDEYFMQQAELTVGGMKERELLVDAMNETQEKSAGKKFKDFWKKHAKLRMAIGAGLTAGAFIFGATGNIPVMAALLAGRVAMSGVGTTMTVEAAWEGVRQKFGKTGEIKEQKIDEMTDGQLEEYYAAQSVGAADRNLKRGEKVSFFGRKKDSKTAELVDREIQSRRRIALRTEALRLKEEGKSNDEIVAASLESILKSEQEGHKQLESRTDWLRKNNIKKWVTAVTAGAIMAGVVGVRGIGQIREAMAIKEVPTTPSPDTDPTQPPAETPPAVVAGPTEVAPTEVAATTPDVPSIDGIETAGKGDSVWKLIDHQLEKRLSSYGSLTEAQKTHLIDQFKDRVSENPKTFGLDNVDNLKMGQKVDLSSLFEGQDKIGQALEHTKDLSESQLENIFHNNGVLREWVTTHPSERLTSDMVEKILHGNSTSDVVQDAATTVKGQSVLSSNDWRLGSTTHPGTTGFGGQSGADAIHHGAGMDTLGDQFREHAKGVSGAMEHAVSNPETAVAPKELLKFSNRFDVVAPTETHLVIEHADKVMAHIGKVTDTLPDSTLKRLTDISVGDFVKRSKGVAKSIATMEGFSDKSANEFVKNVKKLITDYADKAAGGKVDREWTLGQLSKVVEVAEKAKK